MPQELNTKRTTGNKVSVSWQHPSNITCNITYYTVCYRENLTEPCREVLAPEKQRNVTLCELTADQKYIVQVRAHTAKGPGNYSNEKTFETDWKKGGYHEWSIRVNWISIELDWVTVRFSNNEKTMEHSDHWIMTGWHGYRGSHLECCQKIGLHLWKKFRYSSLVYFLIWWVWVSVTGQRMVVNLRKVDTLKGKILNR
jgi:hypothetical protein